MEKKKIEIKIISCIYYKNIDVGIRVQYDGVFIYVYNIRDRLFFLNNFQKSYFVLISVEDNFERRLFENEYQFKIIFKMSFKKYDAQLQNWMFIEAIFPELLQGL
jgi:hypothetical protein